MREDRRGMMPTLSCRRVLSVVTSMVSLVTRGLEVGSTLMLLLLLPPGGVGEEEVEGGEKGHSDD